MSGANQNRAVKIPPDAQVYVVTGADPSTEFGGAAAGTPLAGVEVWVVFNVAGVRVAYRVDLGNENINWKSFPTTTVTKQQFDQLGVINGGSAVELATVVDDWGTFGAWFNNLLDILIGPNNPARYDPEVLAVIGRWAARPNMSEAELRGLILATKWYQDRTDAEREWNSLAPAEQKKRIEEAAAQIADLYWRLAGQRLDPSDSRITQFAELMASGRISPAEVQRRIRNEALGISESPAWREDRDEAEAQRQRGITIENTMGNIRQLLQRWGLTWTEDMIKRWAESLVANVQSDDDLLRTLKAQAASLYPWKDPDMETLDAAQPWMSTYERVMERQASLFDPQIQSVLTSGSPAWQFEQELKKSDDWLGTRNAQSSMVSTMSQVGQMMGFV